MRFDFVSLIWAGSLQKSRNKEEKWEKFLVSLSVRLSSLLALVHKTLQCLVGLFEPCNQQLLISLSSFKFPKAFFTIVIRLRSFTTSVFSVASTLSLVGVSVLNPYLCNFCSCLSQVDEFFSPRIDLY
jgi:hypothetical protein